MSTGDYLQAKIEQRERAERLNREMGRELSSTTTSASSTPSATTLSSTTPASDTTLAFASTPASSTAGERGRSEESIGTVSSTSIVEEREQSSFPDDIETMPKEARRMVEEARKINGPQMAALSSKGKRKAEEMIEELPGDDTFPSSPPVALPDQTGAVDLAQKAAEPDHAPEEQPDAGAAARRDLQNEISRKMFFVYFGVMMITHILANIYIRLPNLYSLIQVNQADTDATTVNLLAGLDPMWSKLDGAKFSHCAISHMQCELYPDPPDQDFYDPYLWQHEVGWCTSPSNCAGDPRPFRDNRFNATVVGDALLWTSGVFWNISYTSHIVAWNMKRFYRAMSAFDTAYGRILEDIEGLWDGWLGDWVLRHEDELCHVNSDCEGAHALTGPGLELCPRYPTQPPTTKPRFYLVVKWLLTSRWSAFSWVPLRYLVPYHDSVRRAFLIPEQVCIYQARQRRILTAITRDLDEDLDLLAGDLARDCKRRLKGLEKVLHREGFWDYNPERKHVWVGDYLWDRPAPGVEMGQEKTRASQRIQGGMLDWDGTVQGWVEGYLIHACDALQPDDPYAYRLQDDDDDNGAAIDTPLKTFKKFTSDLRSAAGLSEDDDGTTWSSGRSDSESDRYDVFKPRRTLMTRRLIIRWAR
ncbi:hypothetical protein Tdes44962_MAKER03137 [Teratosphaeria destructans]|uniref:Uncharacterized protein n=1 Tax=Teratosphaeria destructans TaxID=418781 RepID=A0A9W7SQV0_9PEZI|nr:hypothetical protein Tdes44962_MAKER03137 [Teratosphaeria destructans]